MTSIHFLENRVAKDWAYGLVSAGREFWLFLCHFFWVKGAHCGAKTHPYTFYLQLSPISAPIWDYLKGASDFDCISPFFGTPPFMCFPPFTNPICNYLQGAPKTRNWPFGRGQKVPQKSRQAFICSLPIHPHSSNAYLNRPHCLLWLYIVELPATFTFHRL